MSASSSTIQVSCNESPSSGPGRELWPETPCAAAQSTLRGPLTVSFATKNVCSLPSPHPVRPPDSGGDGAPLVTSVEREGSGRQLSTPSGVFDELFGRIQHFPHRRNVGWLPRFSTGLPETQRRARCSHRGVETSHLLGCNRRHVVGALPGLAHCL